VRDAMKKGLLYSETYVERKSQSLVSHFRLYSAM
jgi:hypothetical protein